MMLETNSTSMFEDRTWPLHFAFHYIAVPDMFSNTQFRGWSWVPVPVPTLNINHHLSIITHHHTIPVIPSFWEDPPLPAADKQGEPCEVTTTGNAEPEPSAVGRDTFDWVEFNRRKKAEAATWVQSSPYQRLACIRPVAGVLLRVMYKFLYLTGKVFERTQRLLSASGRPRTYAVLEACNGRDLENALTALLSMLWQVRPPGILPHDFTARLKALRFRLISCTVCALHILLRVRRSGCPFKVFQVLQGLTEDLLATPHCMRDNLANMILGSYAPRRKFSAVAVAVASQPT